VHACQVQSSMNITYGLFLNVKLPRNLGKWIICNDLIFTSYQVNGKYRDFVNGNHYTIYSKTFEFLYLKFNTQIRFKYPIGNAFIYCYEGISNAFAIYDRNNRRKEAKFYSSETVEEDLALNDTRAYEQGYVMGLRTGFKKIGIEARFEKGNGMSVYGALSSLTDRYYLLLSYIF
jgi:hypothetical protein